MLASQSLERRALREKAVGSLQSGEKACCHPLHFSNRGKGDTAVLASFIEPNKISKKMCVNVE